MVTNSIKISDVKSFLSITYSDHDAILSSIIIPAAEAMILSHITEDESSLSYFINNHIYIMAVLLLSGHYYENRSATSTFKKEELPFGVKAAIKELRMGWVVWKSVV